MAYDSRAKIRNTDLADVNVINDDSTLGRIHLESSSVKEMKGQRGTHETQETLSQCRLSTACRNSQAQLKVPWDYVPVRPSNPTRSLAFRLKDTLCRTGGSSGAYLIVRSSTTSRLSFAELEGQYAGTRLDSMMDGGS
jgi:hypothetical protein